MWYDTPMPLAPVQRVKEWWRSLPTETRFSTSILGVCGIVIIILSTVYMRANVLSPFRVSNNVLKPAQELYAQQLAQANELEASKTKDTDRDGLSDYSELYVYRTSPYLGDTDSDGIPDAIEIAQTSDPNCPAGSTCLQLANQQPAGASTSSFRDLIDVTQFQNDPNLPSEIKNAQEFIDTAKEPSQYTTIQIRELLTKYKLVASDRLAALSDDEVRAVYVATYAQVLKIRESAVATTSTTP